MEAAHLIEEFTEAGIDRDLAELLAPIAAPLKSDPRGFRVACVEREPALAAVLGLVSMH